MHFNGRVYDPFVGRMMSADPVVGDPLNAQTWNRYSYVYNRPLTLTDPTGLCPTSACIGYAGPARVSGSGLQLATSLLRIIALAVCVGTPGCPTFLPLFAAATASASTMINGGNLNHALTAGAIAGATAIAFQAVGDITSQMPGAELGPNGTHGTFDFGSPGHLANIAGHALVGCGSAAASGGKCGAGALSGAVPAFAGPVIYEPGFTIRGLAANSALGGPASVAGGGKFANGAVTGAFGYLFNQIAFWIRPNLPVPMETLGETVKPLGETLKPAEEAIPPQGMTPLDELPAGSTGGPGAGKAFPRSLSDQPEGTPCQYCARPTTREPGPDQYNGDHNIPKSQGGNNTPENHIDSCRTCNLDKAARTPQEWYRTRGWD